ncbi:MAG TPA: hypothetical protein VK752_14935 [Bryobacteraceae bacterium]|jgi:hypothetical protein|nr:hypothetical protein [Bryobacteraceae bacterium]
MTQKLIVIEINEMPLRVFRQFAKMRPDSHVDELLKSSQVIETLAQDVEQSFLYPSQSWASLNTGAPYSSHKIHWYNDPKPDEYPLYWKTLAQHDFSVGIVGSLHSSPAEAFAGSNKNYKFVIPDCFAPDSYTKPGYFEPFQKLNLKAVSSNARVASTRVPVQDAAMMVMNSPRYGIRMRTIVEGASLVYKIMRKNANRERLRNLQFPLIADMFLHLFQKHQPDVAITFTNHVAGNMHRYWYALFPEDYDTTVYDNRWISKYSSEITAAVDLLDSYMGELMRLAKETDRILVVVSSMGQEANPNLTPDAVKARTHGYRLENVRKFIGHFTKNRYSFEVDSAMVPQYTLAFGSVAESAKFAAEVREAMEGMKDIDMVVDQNREIVTLSVTLNGRVSEYVIQGRTLQCEDLGFERFEIDDHHSGCHCPEGSLIIYNSRTAKASQPSVDYLEYAPAMLSHFGIEPPPYMLKPSFSF